MSNLDPFTQKLLQRTQERKEARLKMQTPSTTTATSAKGRSPAKPTHSEHMSNRQPLVEKPEGNTDSSGTSKKRQSSEQMENAPLSPVQKVTVKRVCAELSPTKHSVPSKSRLANRLNQLNQHYTEQLELDSVETKRLKELQVLGAEKKKQDDAQRAKEIQEKIFGKYAKAASDAKEDKKQAMMTPEKNQSAVNSGARTESFRRQW
jgi:hypothetical protein